jgi:urease accessory protein
MTTPSHRLFSPLRMGLGLGIILTMLGYLWPRQALAHHFMDGSSQADFGLGFLSGFAHPIIGIDHLAFIIAIGLITINLPRFWLVAASFIAASMLGVLIYLQAPQLSGHEIAIALSVILVGTLLALRSGWSGASQTLATGIGLSLLAGLAGILHGYGYGEAIIGTQTSAILAYLLGLAIIQTMIAWGSHALGRSLCRQFSTTQSFRYGGISIAGVGLLVLLSHLSMG